MRHSRTAVPVILLALSGLTTVSGAQVPEVRGVRLWPGTEIRAWFDELVAGVSEVRGRIVVLSGDTLRVTPRGTGTMATYPLRRVSRLEIRGHRQRKLGFTLGALVGTGISAALAANDWRGGHISRDQFAGIVAGGLLAGGWTGFAFAPREWTELPLR